jgi:hypothetical protein
MNNDPVEREREFRAAIERFAQEQRNARLRRARPLLAWLISRVDVTTKPLWPAAALVAVLFFGSFFLIIFGFSIKWSDPYSCALTEARRSTAVEAELGQPVEAGFFAWLYYYSKEGSITDTAFRTKLTGPKGEGTLRVHWYASPVGSSVLIELEKDGRTVEVFKGPVPCR